MIDLSLCVKLVIQSRQYYNALPLRSLAVPTSAKGLCSSTASITVFIVDSFSGICQWNFNLLTRLLLCVAIRFLSFAEIVHDEIGHGLLVPRTQRLKESSLCKAVQGSGNPLTVARHFSNQLDVACALAPC